MGGKKPLICKCPNKAISILRNKPQASVFIIPDLYPPNVPVTHQTFPQLKNEIEKRFTIEFSRRKLEQRLKDRLHIHCFKYDFESLVLAAENELMKRLGIEAFTTSWKKPVEDQNHKKPPKRIVEELFRSCGKKYKDTIDAPWILERADLNELQNLCKQSFKPFIEDLLSVLDM
jgi:hypothetical protein